MTGGRSVVEGAFRVLQALPEIGSERQVASIADLTGLPRPTVHRLLVQLRQAGAVERVEGLWVLSAEFLGLAGRAEPHPGLRARAVPVVQTLREQTGATVSFVVPMERSLVALEMVPGREALPIVAQAGALMPSTSAAGLLLGADRTASPRLRSFAAAVDDEDVIPGLSCYAVSVRLPRGRSAALQIATPSSRPAERFAAAVHHAAAAIERGSESAPFSAAPEAVSESLSTERTTTGQPRGSR